MVLLYGAKILHTKRAMNNIYDEEVYKYFSNVGNLHHSFNLNEVYQLD